MTRHVRLIVKQGIILSQDLKFKDQPKNQSKETQDKEN